MAKKDYENMTVEQLEKENQKLMQQKQDIKQKQAELKPVLDAKVDTEWAERKAKDMSPKQQDALRKVLQPGGINSTTEQSSPGLV